MTQLLLERGKDLALGIVPISTPDHPIWDCETRIATMEEVCDIVCDILEFPEEFLHNKSRKVPIPIIRSYCYYYGYKYTELNYTKLSVYFADFNTHLAAWHGCMIVSNLIQLNKNVRMMDEYIKLVFKNSKFIRHAKAHPHIRLAFIPENSRYQAAI